MRFVYRGMPPSGGLYLTANYGQTVYCHDGHPVHCHRRTSPRVSVMPKRPGPGPDLDDIDADLRGAPDELLGDDDPDDPIDAPLSSELDLHTFLPKECADVVAEYVRAAQEAGMTAVRIVHGKGTGTLRTTVHALLQRSPDVVGFRGGDETSGSWGATIVTLRK